jgi:hypothetical protein
VTIRKFCAQLYAAALIASLSTGMILVMVKSALHQRQVSQAEKRELTLIPEFPRNLAQWEQFPPKFEAFFNDNFGFRNDLIRMNFKTAALVGSIPSDRVFKGKDGWLFSSEDRAIDLYENALPLSETALERWKTELKARKDWLASQGVGYAYVAAPEKYSIYDDYMPRYLRKKRAFSQYDQIAEATKNTDVNFIDLRPGLVAEKNTETLYLHDDTHWNDRGAYLAYREIIEGIGKQIDVGAAQLTQDNFHLRERGPGDLAVIAALSRKETAPTLKLETLPCPSPIVEDQQLAPYYSVFMRTRCDGAKHKLLLFRDSFSIALMPLLAQSFAEVVAVWKEPTIEDIKAMTLKERPDFVMEERAERKLNRAP